MLYKKKYMRQVQSLMYLQFVIHLYAFKSSLKIILIMNPALIFIGIGTWTKFCKVFGSGSGSDHERFPNPIRQPVTFFYR